MLKKTGKTLEHAVSGEDYVDAEGNPVGERLIVWSGDNRKLLANTSIQVIDGKDVRGVNSLHAELLQARNSVTSDQNIIAGTSLEGKQLILYDEVSRMQKYVSFKAPSVVTQNIVWVLPEHAGTTGQVLTDIGAVGVSTDRQLAFKNILPDNLQDTLLSQGRDGQNNPVFVNATLTKGKVWQGDEQNKPVEVSLEIAPAKASYIVKSKAENELPNAQALNQLVGLPGIAKISMDGSFSLAQADVDYASVSSVERVDAKATAAQATADGAVAEAGIANAGVASLWAQLFPFIPIMIPPFNIGSVVTGLVGSVATLTAGLATKENSSDHDHDIQELKQSIATKTSLPEVRENLKFNELGCTDAVSLENHRLTHVGLPEEDLDAINKQYFDQHAGQIAQRQKPEWNHYVFDFPIQDYSNSTGFQYYVDTSNDKRASFEHIVSRYGNDEWLCCEYVFEPKENKTFIEFRLDSHKRRITYKKGQIAQDSSQTFMVMEKIGLLFHVRFDVPVSLPSLITAEDVVSQKGDFVCSEGALKANTIRSYDEPVIQSLSPMLINDAAEYRMNDGTGQQIPYSLVCVNAVRASEYVSTSSIEVKKLASCQDNIDEEALAIFKKIPLHKYTFKNKLRDGSGVRYGVIAESLRSVLPELVHGEQGREPAGVMKQPLFEMALLVVQNLLKRVEYLEHQMKGFSYDSDRSSSVAESFR